MAAPHSDFHLSHGPFANKEPGYALGSPDDAGARPGCQMDATPSKSIWGPWLVRLFFGAGLIAVVLVVGPMTCRLGQQSRSARPAPRGRMALARPRQQVVIEADRGPGEGALAVPAQLPGTEEEKQTSPPGQAEGADAPLEAAQADQVFEQRLRASEEDLRARLRDIPEVCLLSDGAVQRVRGAERAAQKQIVESARAAREAARVSANAANARVNALRVALNANRRDPELARAEREAARAALAAHRAFLGADGASRRAVSRAAPERERIGYEGSLRLHQTLKRTAVRAGLALQSGPACQLAPSTAAQVAKLSKELRDRGFVSVPGVSSTVRFPGGGVIRRRADGVVVISGLTGGGVAIDGRGVTFGGRRVRLPNGRDVDASGSAGAGEAARGATKAFAAWCDQHRLEKMSGTVPTLTQMLQIENEAKRLLLVRELTRVRSAAATKQLAVRAIVDLSPAVRQAAVAGLAKRPWRRYGPVLLWGLRYPWAPVADHAAVALRALNPPEAVASLVDLLDLPSPSAPVLDARTNKYAVRELVRLNHLRNCLLCHAPSASKEDGLVRGLVPVPGEPLPVVYYEAQGGNFVRADRTFLRQDFSVILTEEDAAPWPREQRYDFVTRLRAVSPGQVTDPPAWSSYYPQRDAVLYALRGLTGKDGGDSSARWRKLLGLIAGKPGGNQVRPEVEKGTISLTDPKRP